MDLVLGKFLKSISDPLPLFMLLVLIGMFILYCRELIKRDDTIKELRSSGETLIKLTTLVEVLVNRGEKRSGEK